MITASRQAPNATAIQIASFLDCTSTTLRHRQDGGGRLVHVKIGFALPVSGSWATPDTVTYFARRAEELGYHELWTFQRLLSAVDGSCYAAAITERTRLGVAVINMPFVSPVLLAKQAATVDILSGGRLDLGLGLGWSDEEYTASNASKKNQARRSEEFIAVLRTLWTDDTVTHEGEFYRIPAAKADPKPVQPGGPPILLGGTAEPALARAGRLADGWVSSSRADLIRIGESVEVVKQAAAEAGRDPSGLRFVCRGAVRVRTDGSRAPLVGTLEQIAEDIAALEERGITEVFVDLNFDPEVGSPDADPAATRDRAEAALTALAPG
jgi:probable F420-dependent oxidoreductase